MGGYGIRRELPGVSPSEGRRAVSLGTSGIGDHRVEPHDPMWRHTAADLIRRVHEILGQVAVRVDHIGSTAVPGLGARPILDIQVSVPDIGASASFDPHLRRAGYVHFKPPGWVLDDYLIYVPADDSNTEHLELCEVDSFHERRHLAVRDYLRSHPDESLDYERVKRASAEAAGGQRLLYGGGKSNFVVALQQRALDWYETAGPTGETSQSELSPQAEPSASGDDQPES